MNLEIITGDITKLNVDAIVNAANPSLLGGGGVDGAIHLAAGPMLRQACQEIRDNFYPKGLPVGEAVMTEGYNLKSKIIHTVGPIYDQVDNPDELLANAYINSLKLAEENDLRSIAFPAISTGVYGFPRDEAADVVKYVLDEFKFKSLDKVILTYFSREDMHIAKEIIEE